jgi:hypothetical protein
MITDDAEVACAKEGKNMINIAERQRRRQEVTDDIVERVRNAVQEELANAPKSLEREDLESIEEHVLDHTRLVVDALSFEEMQSEGALLSHIANARCDTNRLMRERRPPAKQEK